MAPNNKPIYVFDHVRSNSQLFNKLFAAHPQLEQVFMPMLAASLYGPDAILRGRKHSEKTEQAFISLANASGAAETESSEAALQRMESAVVAIQQKGKTPWLKDHAFCVVPRSVQDSWTAGTSLTDGERRNPTMFSTEFLDNVTPVFLIRHPALSIPSFFRKDIVVCKNKAGDEDFPIYTALWWSRLIFDSFVLRSENSDIVPVVIDAADVIHDTQPTLQALCERLEIEWSGVQLSWDSLPDSDWPTDAVLKTFFADLFKSTGVERRADKPAENSMDLDARQAAWTEDFGPRSAETLRVLVEKELEHYEYLQKFKLRA